MDFMERQYRIKESVYLDGTSKFVPECKDEEQEAWRSMVIGWGSFSHKLDDCYNLIMADKRDHEIPKVVYHDFPPVKPIGSNYLP